METELIRRYDYSCCDTVADFRRATRALTVGGQSKDSRVRHTKDDRYDVNDRRQYILGWSNKPKIKALEEEQCEVQAELSEAESEQQALRNGERALDQQRRVLERLREFPSFEALDFKPLVIRIDQLQEEQRQLESGSDELKLLQAKIAEAEALAARLRTQTRAQDEQRGVQKDTLSKLLASIARFLQQMELPPLRLRRPHIQFSTFRRATRCSVLVGRTATIPSRISSTGRGLTCDLENPLSNPRACAGSDPRSDDGH